MPVSNQLHLPAQRRNAKEEQEEVAVEVATDDEDPLPFEHEGLCNPDDCQRCREIRKQ